jgi:hypothetical protein
MNAFRVAFNDNIATSARKVSSYRNSIKMSIANGKKEVKWLIVYAYDMQESIARANSIIKKYFRFLHPYL